MPCNGSYPLFATSEDNLRMTRPHNHVDLSHCFHHHLTDPSAPEDFPKSFPSLTEALGYLEKRRGHLDVTEIKQIINKCANRLYNNLLKKAGWGRSNPPQSTAAPKEIYPERPWLVFWPPQSR